jgi:hypothetical protein
MGLAAVKPPKRHPTETGNELAQLAERARSRVASFRDQRRLEADFARLIGTGQGLTIPDREGASRVGIATFGSGPWHLVIESLLGHALAVRGALPELLVCDIPTLPVCDERTVFARHIEVCSGCVRAKSRLLESCALPWRGMNTLLGSDALHRARMTISAVADEDLAGYHSGQWAIGKWIHVSACHFLRCDARGDEPYKIEARRRFLTSALVVLEAVEKWLDDFRPDAVLVESGAHFMWRIVFELARARGIRVISRELGKGGWDSHIYSVNALSMFPNWDELWPQVRGEPLSPLERRQTDEYLGALPVKTYPRAAFAPAPASAPAEIRRQLGLNAGRKVAVLFTNVTWDLAAAGRDAGFDGMLDWVSHTVELARQNPGVDLVIRAHPAEAEGGTRERVLDVIGETWPMLPENVRLVSPETGMSVRGLCEVADLVIVYTSTTGLESAIYGKPVLVCGTPHYRGKGFTIDISSREEYSARFEAWVEGSLERLSTSEDSELARRYFHLFFLRHHIPMGWTTSPLLPPFRLKIQDVRELLPGNNRSVDLVCAGVLAGDEILLPREPVATGSGV